MNIRPFLCLLLMMGPSVPGGSPDPLALLNQAREAEAKKHDFKKALAMLEAANAIWENQGASSAEYGQSLTLAAILLARESEVSGKIDPSAVAKVNRAIGIYRANQSSDAEDLALALEVRALVTDGKNMQYTAEWKEAAAIRSRRFSEGLPAPTGNESPATHFGGGQENVMAPKLISKVRPDYTEAARILRIRGKVIMSVTIETDGMPSGGSMKQGLGFGLDEEAAKAVRQWRFQPASKDGAAVRMGATIEMAFKLL